MGIFDLIDRGALLSSICIGGWGTAGRVSTRISHHVCCSARSHRLVYSFSVKTRLGLYIPYCTAWAPWLARWQDRGRATASVFDTFSFQHASLLAMYHLYSFRNGQSPPARLGRQRLDFSTMTPLRHVNYKPRTLVSLPSSRFWMLADAIALVACDPMLRVQCR